MSLASPWRRIAAFVIDWCLLVVWLLILMAASILVGSWIASLGPLLQQAVYGLLTVIPFAAWQAWWEARGGSIGKRAMKLSVAAVGGGRLPGNRAFDRNLLKLGLPWTLGHIGAGWGFANPAAAQLPWWVLACLIAAYGVAGWWLVSLFVGSRRTPYDKVSGSQVVEASGR